MLTLIAVIGTIAIGSILGAFPITGVYTKAGAYAKVDGQPRYGSLRSNESSSLDSGKSVRAKLQTFTTRDSESRFHDGTFVYVPKATPEPETELFYGGSFRYQPSSDSRTESPANAVAPQTAAPTVVFPTTANSRSQAGSIPVVVVAAPQYESASVNTQSTAATNRVGDSVEQSLSTQYSYNLSERSGDGIFYTGEFILSAAEEARTNDAHFYGGSFMWDATTNRLRPTRNGGLIASSQILNMSMQMPPLEGESITGQDAPTIIEPMALSKSAISAAISGASPSVATAANIGVDGILTTYWDRSVLPITGKAMYYNPGIMQYVLNYRLDLAQVEQCPECVGYVALLRAGDLNRHVWIQWPDTGIEGPYLVVDVAARQHVSTLLSRDWVVDVDYRTAMRHGMNGPVTVTVMGYSNGAGSLK